MSKTNYDYLKGEYMKINLELLLKSMLIAFIIIYETFLLVLWKDVILYQVISLVCNLYIIGFILFSSSE